MIKTESQNEILEIQPAQMCHLNEAKSIEFKVGPIVDDKSAPTSTQRLENNQTEASKPTETTNETANEKQVCLKRKLKCFNAPENVLDNINEHEQKQSIFDNKIENLPNENTKLAILTPSTSSCASSTSSTMSSHSTQNQKRPRKNNHTTHLSTKIQENQLHPPTLTPPPSVSIVADFATAMLDHNSNNSNNLEHKLNSIDAFGNFMITPINKTSVITTRQIGPEAQAFNLEVCDDKNRSNQSESLILNNNSNSSQSQSHIESESFKLPTSKNEHLSGAASCSSLPQMSNPALQIQNMHMQKLKRADIDISDTSELSDLPTDSANIVDSEKYPETLEELLLKQWDLGAELCMEQSKNFDSKLY